MSSPLTDKINALTAYANEITGESDTTLSDAVASLADGYGQGGGISQGIVVTAVDSGGFPTEVEIYGDLWKYEMSYDGIYYHNTIGWRNVATIKLMSDQTVLPEGCFYGVHASTITGLEKITTLGGKYCLCGTAVETINMPFVTAINMQSPFSDNTALKTVNLPNVSGQLTAGTFMLFGNCTALESVTIGSVGHCVTNNNSTGSFNGCTQSGLTITIYTNGANVDALNTNIRRGATNATIILKAAENTTYNGTSYAAGDTILTSTP